jgi:hypothetical protein
LGSLVGANATDPVNVLGKAGTCSKSTQVFCVADNQCPRGETCVVHDATTGWSTQDRRFSFACATSSYAYRYLSQGDTKFTLKSHFENVGVKIANFDALTKDFIDTQRVIINDPNGICNQNEEISTLNQGKCGDGQVNFNRGEECDPPGRINYGACSADQKDKIKVEVCDANCKWTPSSTPYVACSYLSNCGNGKIEVGETCDDGPLNGRYNHCTATCTWPPNNPPGYCGDREVQPTSEVCDIKDKLTANGICVEGLLRGKQCNSNLDCNIQRSDFFGDTIYFAGKCALIDDTKVRYDKEKNKSCNWDCQATGPYCGDGIVQAEFGEQCDGNQSCSIGNQSGQKLCAQDCRWKDAQTVAWWQFNDAVLNAKTGVSTFFDGNGFSYADGSCKDKDCPTFSAAGKVRGAFMFNGSNFLTIPASAKLVPTSSLSVEAWIKPTEYADWMRVLEKGGYLKDGGYGLQFDNSRHQGFVVWDANSKNSFGVSTVKEIPLNEWTHIVGIYQKRGFNNLIKIYVNGKLDNSYALTTTTVVMAPSSQDLMIGRSVSGGSFFKGLIDEVKIYHRVLSDAEIADHYAADGGVCTPNAVLGDVAIPASCGDGQVDEGEACDKGPENGISCVPAYGKSCTYCSNTCKNIVDVQPQEYCGNGKVEGPEACETDLENNKMYAAGSSEGTVSNKDTDHNGFEILSCSQEVQATTTLKKGTKSCGNKCSAILSSCIECGALPADDKRGVTVTGNIINVIDPGSKNPILGPAYFKDTGPFSPPLLVFEDAKLDLLISTKKIGHSAWKDLQGNNTYYFKSVTEDAYATSSVPAKINSDSKCSFGDVPNYKVRVNEDNNHLFDFPVLAKPQTWQYDLILSPIINANKRPNDIRIVVSWVGNDPDFYGGFIIPVKGSGSAYEGASFAATSTGNSYFSKTATEGMWYHGFAYTPGKSNMQSFTVDTSKMIDEQYLFYVRLPQARPIDPGIYRYRDSSLLKVDVYLPENDTIEQHFALPAQTFYLNADLSSPNASAPLWHTFNIKRDGPNAAAKIVPVQKIITEWRNI